MPKRILLAVPLLLAAIAHITWSVRYVWANLLAQQDTAPALHRAAQLTPANAAIFTRLAQLEPERGPQWLDAAIKLNPLDPLLWIERSVNAELAGNPAAAEAALLEAARLDHQYIPRWTLAAFYFRQQNTPQFQTWARKALEVAWGDAQPLFQMADQLGLSLDDIRRNMLPDRAPVLDAFVFECLRRKDLDEAFRTARRLIEIGTATSRATVLATTNALFDAGRTKDSVQLWNQAAAAHWFPHSPIPPLVPNPEFSFEFLPDPAGFDWRHQTVDGIVFWRIGAPRGLEIEITGREPESCTLLTLPLPLEPEHSYTIQTTTTTSIPKDTGLKWRVGKQEWDVLQDSMTIQAPAEPAQLALVYNRALGTKRLEGNFSIHRVSVTLNKGPVNQGPKNQGPKNQSH